MNARQLTDLLFEKLALRGSYTQGVFQRLVAARYVEAPESDPATFTLFKLFAEKVQRQHKQLSHKYDLAPTLDDPYPSMKAMSKDIRAQHAQGKRARVPVYAAPPEGIEKMPYGNEENTTFRGVHDVIAHYFGQHPFSGRGEYSAYNRHLKTLGPKVAPILFTEIVGQTSVYKVYGTYTGQKAAILTDFDPLNIGALAADSPLNKYFVLANKVLQPRRGFNWHTFSEEQPQLAKTLGGQPGFDPATWENYDPAQDASVRNPKQKR